MSNSVAEAYLLITRQSNAPIFGEAVPVPFTGQIELDSWEWEIKNKEADADGTSQTGSSNGSQGGTRGGTRSGARSGTGSGGATGAQQAERREPIKPDSLIREVKAMQTKTGMSQDIRDKKVLELIRRAVAGYNEDSASEGEDADADKGKEMTLKFEKGVDLATTPLLFALARGDVIPSAVLTLFHRSKNAPVTLAITMGNLRFTNYTVTCDPTDAMSDLKESWVATYQTLSWMYQNRPAASGPNFLTQGTVRVFTMDVPIPI